MESRFEMSLFPRTRRDDGEGDRRRVAAGADHIATYPCSCESQRGTLTVTQTSLLQSSDVVHSLERGVALGGATGALPGPVALTVRKRAANPP
jgi:hypothetical protein